MTPLDLSSISLEQALGREWLCANHLGGYASSTILGLNTRKYHGLLIAALSPPVRRMVILSRVEEFVRRDGWVHPLCNSEYPGVIHPAGHQLLRAFATDPFPRWAWQSDGWTIQRHLQLLEGSNTVCLSYVLVGTDRPVELELSPLFALRPIHELMYQWNGALRTEPIDGGMHIPATSRTPEAFFSCDGKFEAQGTWYLNTIYRREQERGYAGLEDLWRPGIIRWTLKPGEPVHFACSTEPIDLKRTMAEVDLQVGLREGEGARADESRYLLEEAGRQFVLDTTGIAGRHRAGHQTPMVRAPVGGSLKSANAQSSNWAQIMTVYPWMPPMGRSALIAMPGLLLVTGRMSEARRLLMGFISAMRNGLMPSVLAEDGSGPVYEGADVSLWFVQAGWQYLQHNPMDQAMRHGLWAATQQIVQAYRNGTDPGISLDEDGLVNVQIPGATWMDARLGDWVATPRQGRPVEINALWYNALCIGAQWAVEAGDLAAARQWTALAQTVQKAFNRRFWNESVGCCVDLVREDGVDASIRPNQLLAISLPHPVLEESRQADALKVVMEHLLTPMGLRTLSPEDPAYQGRYGGDVLSRDRARHQGSVHAWLLGPLVTAVLRQDNTADARKAAMRLIEGPLAYMRDEGMGQLCELFNGDAPHLPGGGIACAASVGEILRCYVEEIQNCRPAPAKDQGGQQTVETLIVPPFESPHKHGTASGHALRP